MSELADVARVPRPSRGAVLFFGHAAFAYGHVARCHKVARMLVRETSLEAYVVSSFPDFVTGEEIPDVHEVLLPAFGLANPDSPPDGLPIPERASPLPHVPVAELSRHRAGLLRALVAWLAPRAVLFEGFPLVRPTRAVEECAPALALLAAEAPATVRLAGFNGVPTAMFVENHAPLIEWALREIDRLFVYVDEEEREAVLARCAPLRAVEAKLRFVGYVGSDPPPPPAVPERRILATFGGGIDARRKIVLACEAFLEFVARRPGWALDVVTGGQFPEAGYREIVSRYAAAPTVRVRRFVPGLARQLNRYALVLSMGGYNACTELYQASTRSIALPRVSPRFMEQWDQVLKFQGFGAIDHVIDDAATSPAALAALIDGTLAAPVSSRRPLDLGGAAAAARLLARAVMEKTTAD